MQANNIKWIKYSFGSIILIVLIISIFNYKIDSLSLFGNSNYLSKVAKILVNGQMVAGLKNYDDRLLQKLIIKNLKIKSDIIVIGSSRTMQMRQSFFRKKINFFNHSVSGASLEDYIAIVGAYEYIHKYLPSTIILGVDPWIFNKYNSQNRWQTLSKYYNYEIKKIKNKEEIKSFTVNISKWKQLLNYEYTIANIKFFTYLNKNNGKIFYITDDIDIDDSIKDCDGSIYYPYKQRYMKVDNTKKYSENNVYSLERFYKLNNIKLFKIFINYLTYNGVRVILFLPPYNPASYDIMVSKAKYKNLVKVEKYLIDFAKKNQVKLIGSYNPHKYNLKINDFFDEMHAHDYVLREILKKEYIDR
ncbi:MAG: hypothetical protein COB17_09435 [Sulfurimonas sp.]|nr:MAG: hypothetical protein COB17_09435 [Sulfurimonas sp.]